MSVHLWEDGDVTSWNACDPHQLAPRMVVKDISSLSIDDVIFTIYDWIVAKTFSDHPDFEMDGHKGSFATIQWVWMVTKTLSQSSKYSNWCGSQAFLHTIISVTCHVTLFRTITPGRVVANVIQPMMSTIERIQQLRHVAVSFYCATIRKGSLHFIRMKDVSRNTTTGFC